MSNLLAWCTEPSGHHADGTPVSTVRPVRWDAEHRAAADRLDQLEPGSMVWYGPWSRRFYAIAAWNAPSPLLLDAPTAEELRDQMRQVEPAVLTATFPPHSRTTGAA
jgi:hypothetical protein